MVFGDQGGKPGGRCGHQAQTLLGCVRGDWNLTEDTDTQSNQNMFSRVFGVFLVFGFEG